MEVTIRKVSDTKRKTEKYAKIRNVSNHLKIFMFVLKAKKKKYDSYLCVMIFLKYQLSSKWSQMQVIATLTRVDEWFM